MSDGDDVGQLTQDLIALGFGAGLTQSNHYSSATAAAVEALWETAVGMSATGTVLLGEAVFELGPIRVTSVTPSGRPGHRRWRLCAVSGGERSWRPPAPRPSSRWIWT